MKTRTLRANLLLLLAAAIWGFSFVAQRVGMDYVGPFTFNGIRFALGSVTLVPILLLARRNESRSPRLGASVMRGGMIAGTALFLGASLQQIGMVHTTAGKGGFITGLYVVLVPILGLFLRHRASRANWAGALLAVTGLYLLSVRAGFSVNPGDLLVFVSSFFWAAHVLLIGWWTLRVGAIELAALQFAVCSVLSLVVAALFETTTAEAVRAAAIPILYGGIGSVGIAFTLQVVAQRNATPAATAILLSLEAVFAALGGWWLLGETLTPRGFLGCALMLAGVLTSQLAGAIEPANDPSERRRI